MHNAGCELRRIYLPRTWVNRLVGQLLQGPAVPVRIAEGSVQDAPKVLYFVDPNSSLDELHTRGVYVQTTKCRPWTEPGGVSMIPIPKAIEQADPGGVS